MKERRRVRRHARHARTWHVCGQEGTHERSADMPRSTANRTEEGSSALGGREQDKRDGSHVGRHLHRTTEEVRGQREQGPKNDKSQGQAQYLNSSFQPSHSHAALFSFGLSSKSSLSPFRPILSLPPFFLPSFFPLSSVLSRIKIHNMMTMTMTMMMMMEKPTA